MEYPSRIGIILKIIFLAPFLALIPAAIYQSMAAWGVGIVAVSAFFTVPYWRALAADREYRSPPDLRGHDPTEARALLERNTRFGTFAQASEWVASANAEIARIEAHVGADSAPPQLLVALRDAMRDCPTTPGKRDAMLSALKIELEHATDDKRLANRGIRMTREQATRERSGVATSFTSALLGSSYRQAQRRAIRAVEQTRLDALQGKRDELEDQQAEIKDRIAWLKALR
jgi:hypothetical protein